MTRLLITAVEPNYTITRIVIDDMVIDGYVGVPERLPVNEAINYRAKAGGALLPFLREYEDYFTPERLRCHLPYFRNATKLY